MPGTPDPAAPGGSRLREGMLAKPRVALPLIVAISTVVQFALDRSVTLPSVLGDELIYSGLGKSLARSGQLLVRGHTDIGHSIIYPLLISPAYALTSNGADAFSAIQGLNALVMSLAAIPTYFLARRVTSNGWSLVAAALSVAGPWFTFTASVLTESAFYPLYVLFALVLVRALEQPTARRQLLILATLAVLVGTRWQAIALAPAIVTAVVVYGLSLGRVRTTLRSFGLTWIVYGVAGIAALAIRVTGGSPLGAYGVLARSYNPISLLRWAVWNVASLELALGLVAVAVLPLALSRLLRRDAREPEQALGSVVVALTAWTLASVATLSASAYGLGRLHERSLFYVVPLIVVCLVYWLAEGMPRPRRLVWLVAGIAVALPLLLPERFIRGSPTPDALATVPWEKLARHWPSVPTPLLLALLVAGRTRVLAIAWLLFAFVVVGVVHARNRGFQPANVSKLAWIDTTLPKNGKATVVYIAPEGTCPGETRIGSSQLLVTFTEFFNTTVDRVVNLGGQVVLDGLLSDSLTLRADGVVLDRGHPIAPSNVALDSHIRVDGRRLVVLDPHSPSSMTLWAVRPPLRFVGYHRAPPTCSRPS